MKNKWIKMAGATVAALAVTATLHASVITGGVAITGDYSANPTTPGDLTTATTMTIGPSSSFAASGATGTFASGPITDITFASPITVNPAGNLVPNKVLWTVMIGATTYTFTVTSEFESVDSANQVTLIGNGTFTDGTPADTAFGTYQLGFGVTQTTFSFENNSQTNVPDGGTTAMLLGGALMGLGLLKRKLMA